MLYFGGSETLLKRVVRYAWVLFALGNGAFAASEGSASIAWNPNPETDVAGYKIYWGELSRQYTNVLDVGNSVTATVGNLTSGRTYYCAVKAYNVAQQESAFSAEVTLTYISENAQADTSSRLVLLEAESGTLTSPAAILGSGTDIYVDSTNYSTAANASTTMTFNADVAANYHVWWRVPTPSTSAWTGGPNRSSTSTGWRSRRSRAAVPGFGRGSMWRGEIHGTIRSRSAAIR